MRATEFERALCFLPLDIDITAHVQRIEPEYESHLRLT